jgi:hypothetical protein
MAASALSAVWSEYVDIELIEQERVWWDNIQAYFANRDRRNRDDGEFLRDEIGNHQVYLTKSLMDRDAIPERRLRWLRDGDYNIGTKKSRWEVICDNAGHKKAHLILGLPFWGERYLPFLLGIINLPQSVIDQFRSDADKRWYNAYEMGQAYRAVAKDHGSAKDDAEEFYKLAVDCDYDHYDCRTIRDAIFTYLKR